MHIEDVAKFIESISNGSYYVIIQDSSDSFEVEQDGASLKRGSIPLDVYLGVGDVYRTVGCAAALVLRV